MERNERETPTHTNRQTFNYSNIVLKDMFGSTRRFGFRVAWHEYGSTRSMSRLGQQPNAAAAGQVHTRLSKALATSGLCSRNEAELWIRDGRVSINSQVVTSPAYQLAPKDVVLLDGHRVSIKTSQNSKNQINEAAPLRLWVVNKVSGELVDEKDPIKNRPLMMERLKKLIILPEGQVLRPVTRMEFNSEGLCLVTTNSALARKLSTSSLPRYYRVRIHGLVTDSKVEGLKSGLYADGKKQKPIQVQLERTSKTISWLKVVTNESSSKALKESFAKVFWNITRVISVGFGPYSIGNMPLGSVKEVKLTPEVLNIYRSLSTK